jgi:PEP-CTERM motif-containing protein
MSNLRRLWIACGVAAVGMLVSGHVSAITTVTVDESANASLTLPFTDLVPPNQTGEITPGDIVLCDGPCDTQNPVISDIIQFRSELVGVTLVPSVTMLSDNSDTDAGGSPTADVGFAGIQLLNPRFFEEVTLPDGSEGFFWAPKTNDDPGFIGLVTTGDTTTFTPFYDYSIVSDPAAVPEPSTLGVLVAALAALGFLRLRKPA